MTSKRWTILTISTILVGMIILCTFMYLYDPYNYFKNGKSDLYLKDDSTFTIAGIINNEEYDFAIIGSSLSLGFNVNYVNEKFNCNSINVAGGGFKSKEKNAVMDAVCRKGTANTILCDVNVDNYTMYDIDTLDTVFPYYLFDNSKLNDIKYLLNYDIWFNMMPRVLATEIKSKILKEDNNTYFQNIEGFYQSDIWKSKEASEIIKNLEYGKYVSENNNSPISLDVMEKIQVGLLKTIKENPEQNFIFYFPPYSALYWYTAEKTGRLSELLAIKKYIISQLLEMPNVEVYDFQGEGFIIDLSNYADEIHYTKTISNWIIDQIMNHNNKIESLDDVQEIDERIFELIHMVEENYDIKKMQ